MRPNHSLSPNLVRKSLVESILAILAAVGLACFPILLAYTAHSAVFPPPPATALLRNIAAIATVVTGASLFLIALGYRGAVAGAALGLVAGINAIYPVSRTILMSSGGTAGPIFGAAYFVGSLAAGITVLAVKPKSKSILYPLLQISSAALVLSTAGKIWLLDHPSTTARGLTANSQVLQEEIGTSSVQSRPDVYHIVLDTLGRPDVLQSRYGLDLAASVTRLQGRGFDVDATIGTANYVQTSLSIASMMSGDYIESLSPESTSRKPLYELIQQSPVIRTFKRLGYEFHFIGSTYLLTARHELADQCDCSIPLFGEFESTILNSTFLSATGLGGLDYRSHRTKIRHALWKLESLQAPTRPRFVFANIMAPHPPFVLDASGEAVYPSNRLFSLNDGNAYRGTSSEYKVGYRDQARYLVARLEIVIDRIQQQSRREGRDSVIIVHGDHGPRLRWDVDIAENTDGAESLPVFLAVHWGTNPRAGEAPTSLVNVYRALFTRYFGAKLKLLPNRGFVSSFRLPYRFIAADPASMAAPSNGPQ